jgi:hypothetical protein
MTLPTGADDSGLDNCHRLGLSHHWERRGWRVRCRNCRATVKDALLFHVWLWLVLGVLGAAVVAVLAFSEEIFDLVEWVAGL